ncbi:uncharacterized protein FIBRA_03906 [Fibroporia radiculosa]|uniref:PPPDE domain-containing protein n=1 Tax=Fibroporia radiculosa TaxID=599839 RepID=J4G6J0_9APHY|nr:uncharacterized protein FIBRA_03906 [Fibroporia radiculosa]CCM01838.1 predicted protein [Fibroporia radiculosa]
MATEYRVYVGRFERGGDLPPHWEICIRYSKETGRSQGPVWHLKGSWHGWRVEIIENTFYSKPQAWTGCHFVGTIAANRIPAARQVVEETPIVANDPNWNCQNWVYTALRRLEARGYNIKAPVSFAKLTEDMAEAKRLWDSGEDSD